MQTPTAALTAPTRTWYAFGASVVSENPADFKPGTPLTVVAYLGDDGDERAAQEQVENARLMAAAPELLDALRKASGYLLNAQIDIETGAPRTTAINTIQGGLKIVRDAIAKAGA